MGDSRIITEKRDLVCGLHGCPAPVALRRVDSGYGLSGDALLSFMDREALSDEHDGVEETTFNIR